MIITDYYMSITENNFDAQREVFKMTCSGGPVVGPWYCLTVVTCPKAALRAQLSQFASVRQDPLPPSSKLRGKGLALWKDRAASGAGLEVQDPGAALREKSQASSQPRSPAPSYHAPYFSQASIFKTHC